MSVEHYTGIFNALDADGSGFITFGELQEKLAGHMPDGQIPAYFRSADTSGDNKISLDEFLIVMGAKQPADPREQAMRNTFRAFDVNGDGTISHQELAEALKKHEADHDVERALQMIDADGDGKINYEEFIANVFRQ